MVFGFITHCHTFGFEEVSTHFESPHNLVAAALVHLSGSIACDPNFVGSAKPVVKDESEFGFGAPLMACSKQEV